MPHIILYTAPTTCGKVPLILLEEIGNPFETWALNLPAGEHKVPAYKDINPKGKVPALVIDGAVLTENAAIISYLHERYPDAKLMPVVSDLMSRARQLADLSFCGTTLHPFVTRICLPFFFAGADSAEEVRMMACKGLQEYLHIVEKRLTDGPWWYGDSWSAMDAYLYWIVWRARSCGFDATDFPHLVNHAERMEARPAVQRAIAREAADLARLLAEADAAKNKNMRV